MSNLQLIEVLCNTIDMCMEAVCDLAKRLELVNAYDKTARASVNSLKAKYSEILGADEAPDDTEGM